MQGFNYALAYNRPQESIAPLPQVPNVSQGNINFADWGYVPNVAQNAQNVPPTNFVQGAGYFNPSQFNLAQWFTTRVHLSPLSDLTSQG